jgi:hypothetical protein
VRRDLRVREPLVCESQEVVGVLLRRGTIRTAEALEITA